MLQLTNSSMPARYPAALSGSMSGHPRGFTLIELMVALVVVALLAAFALPAYNKYERQANAALAQQEMQKIAEQLERHRSKNFTYRGFDPYYIYGTTAPMTSITLPRDATGSAIKYTINIVDFNSPTLLLTDTNATGQGWAIKASASDVQNYSFLLTSTGVRCRNKTVANISYQPATCGTGSEGW